MILLMVKKLKSKESTLSLTHITRTIYFFIGFFALSIIIFDSGNLLVRDAVIDRWSLVTVLFVINTLAWFVGSLQKTNLRSLATYGLTISLILFAGFMTYWERGMASSSTIFYILPLLCIATLRNRHALIASAALSAGAYALSAVKYFNDYFNEGYRVQLWGNIALYTSTILVCAWLLMVIAGLRRDSK